MSDDFFSEVGKEAEAHVLVPLSIFESELRAILAALGPPRLAAVDMSVDAGDRIQDAIDEHFGERAGPATVAEWEALMARLDEGQRSGLRAVLDRYLAKLGELREEDSATLLLLPPTIGERIGCSLLGGAVPIAAVRHVQVLAFDVAP